jgi:hypothetical protein
MVEGIIAGAVVLGLIVGFWLTRNAKGPGGLPGVPAENAILDAELRRAEHGEAFESKPDR